ncbi:hypothetical protein OIU76_009723, partial [Salix suchowensis]
MKYMRTSSLKRLFSLKRSSLQDIVFTNEEEKNNKNSKTVQEQEHSPKDPLGNASLLTKYSMPPVALAQVYKGVLGDGEEIAIKRLTKACRDERKEKEFLTEIGTIGH